MITVEELKEKLRNRLIEHDGNVAPNDLIDLIEEAKELGISEQGIARLVPEVDRSINWEQVRAEKEVARKKQQEDTAVQKMRQDELDAAPGTIDALLSYSMADGIVEAEELGHIFDKAEDLGQNIFQLAVKVKEQFDTQRFRPYPNANLSAKGGLKAVLLSTDWYDDAHYKALTLLPQTPVPSSTAPAEGQPRIIHFASDKQIVARGDAASLAWEVAGVAEINISPFGKTTVLRGRQTITPTQSTIYVLTAGTLQQQVKVEVTSPKRSSNWKVVLLILGLLVLIVRLAQCNGIIDFGKDMHSDEPSSDNATTRTSGTTAGPKISTQSTPPPNTSLSTEEYSKLVRTINDYLAADEASDASAQTLTRICNFYHFPMTRFFAKTNATRDYVYNSVQDYKANTVYSSHWDVDEGRTEMKKRSDGTYSIDIYGTYSYNLRKKPGLKTRQLHDRFLLNRDYEINSIEEVK